MRTIEIKLYKFNELSEEAKQKAIEYERSNLDTSFMYDEAYETVKAFERIFPCDSRGLNSWLDVNVNIDDDILDLKGERLRKYILNNFGDSLFTPKFVGSLKTSEYIQHKRIKSPKNVNSVGNRFNPYYSAINVDNSCVLTGVCYDNDMLQPIYDFLDRKAFHNSNLEELIEECYYSLRKTLEDEEDFRNTEECIIEEIEANDYDFTEDGEIY